MRVARNSLRRLYQEGHELCVVPQNISEFWNVCTRPAGLNGLGDDIPGTDRLASRIESMFVLLPEFPQIFRRWRDLVVKYQIRGAKVHDARIVAAMMEHQTNAILTFNVSDFNRFSGILILDPSSY
jgi:hypothetical protein